MQTVKTIPVDLVKWTLKNKRSKDLYLLLCLKNQTHGIFNEAELNRLFAGTSFKTRSTFDKLIVRLIGLHWIKYNPKTGYYKIRGIRSITNFCGGKSKRCIELLPDLNSQNFQAFLFASYVTFRVKAGQYYYNKTDEGKRTTWETTKQEFVFFNPEFAKRYRVFSIGMANIASELMMSRQRANKLKLESAENYFIECYERKEYLGVVTREQCKYKRLIQYEGFIQFKKSRNGEIRSYRILPDEIRSHIRCKRSLHAA